MSATTTYQISPLAYLKLILHSAKYPSSSICGLLIASSSSTSTSSSSSSSSSQIVIEDVIPLLHNWTTLSPMMELGLQLADNYVTSISSKFVGLYMANAHLEDTSIPATLSLIADKLKADHPNTLVVVVRFPGTVFSVYDITHCKVRTGVSQIDNQKLGTTDSPLLPHTFQSSTWKPISSSSLTFSDPSIIRTALTRTRKGDYESLGDFDDHLIDSNIDWLKNSKLTL